MVKVNVSVEFYPAACNPTTGNAELSVNGAPDIRAECFLVLRTATARPCGMT